MNNLIQQLKKADRNNISSYCIPIKQDGKILGRLRPVTIHSVLDIGEIKNMADWRRNNQQYFTTEFKVTAEGTKTWLEKKILPSDKTIIFIVESVDLIPIGHVGLCNIDFDKKHCFFDNILRGVSSHFKGGMYFACSTLLDWCFHTLKMETVDLEVLAHNERAISLYKKLGFKEIDKKPLRKLVEDGVTKWVPYNDGSLQQAERYLLTMRTARERKERSA